MRAGVWGERRAASATDCLASCRAGPWPPCRVVSFETPTLSDAVTSIAAPRCATPRCLSVEELLNYAPLRVELISDRLICRDVKGRINFMLIPTTRQRLTNTWGGEARAVIGIQCCGDISSLDRRLAQLLQRRFYLTV